MKKYFLAARRGTACAGAAGLTTPYLGKEGLRLGDVGYRSLWLDIRYKGIQNNDFQKEALRSRPYVRLRNVARRFLAAAKRRKKKTQHKNAPQIVQRVKHYAANKNRTKRFDEK